MTATQDRAPSAARRAGSLLKELVIVVVGALVISTLLRAFVGQMFIIPSGSMEHTLDIGDRVAVSKIGGFERGEIVVFADPGGWLPDLGAANVSPVGRALEFVGFPSGSTNHLIKRVIGMPGDRVICCDGRGRITVNGTPLDERAYLYTDSAGVQVAPSDVKFDVTVPTGRIWVMGDHRDASADSRCHLQDVGLDGIRGGAAFVPESDVVGPAFAIALPVGRTQLLHVPTTFADVPAPREAAPKEPVIATKSASC
ncbi:MAG: signal peptidase I [Propionibacteriaceae bacterium]